APAVGGGLRRYRDRQLPGSDHDQSVAVRVGPRRGAAAARQSRNWRRSAGGAGAPSAAASTFAAPYHGAATCSVASAMFSTEDRTILVPMDLSQLGETKIPVVE